MPTDPDDERTVIRAARPEDHGQLLVVWRAAVEGSHHFLSAADVDWYEELVASYLPQMTDLRVAEVGSRVVGFIAQHEGEIHMLFVAPQLQGKGVGSALLENVAADHLDLRLDVNEQNPNAVAFYLSRGFEQIGRSELDGQGRPFPLLHLSRRRPEPG